MTTALRTTLVLVLLASGCVAGVGAPAAQTEVAVGRIVDMEPFHGYVVVEFANGRMNVSMDKREMGQYIVGDEIRVDSFGRPQPRLGGGLRPPSDPRRSP